MIVPIIRKVCCRCVRVREVAGGEHGGLDQFICAICVDEWHESEGAYQPIDISPDVIQAITNTIRELLVKPDDLESQQGLHAALWLLAEQQDDPHLPFAQLAEQVEPPDPVDQPPVVEPDPEPLTNPSYWTCACPKTHYRSFRNYCLKCDTSMENRPDALIEDVQRTLKPSGPQ